MLMTLKRMAMLIDRHEAIDHTARQTLSQEPSHTARKLRRRQLMLQKKGDDFMSALGSKKVMAFNAGIKDNIARRHLSW